MKPALVSNRLTGERGLVAVRERPKTVRSATTGNIFGEPFKSAAGAGEFFYTNKADCDVSADFLAQISNRDPGAIHIVIWDGAGFHPQAGDARIPDNVVVVRQPPYSPELNPVERLWDQLRDGLCNRK